MAGKQEVTIDVVVRERGGKKVLKDTGDEARKTGKSFTEMGRDATLLSKKLFEMDIQLRKTAMEMERTGDTSLVKNIRKQQREINALAKVRKDVLGIGAEDKDKGGAGQAVAKLGKASAAAGGKFGSELTKSLVALKGPAIATVAGIGIAASPFLGGVIASAVLGGVGAGGIIGGLALASRDSRVQDAGAALGSHAMSAFTRSADPFVGPAIEAIGVLRGVVDDVSGDMRQAFAAIAPVLVPLTKGVGGFVGQLMPGVIKAMEGARPVLLIVSNELPKIGRALGTFLSTIAEDPRGAIVAFQDLSRIIQGTIIITGNFIAFLGKVWGVLSPIIQAAQGDTVGMVSQIAATESALAAAEKMGRDTGDAFEGMGHSAMNAEQRIIMLNTALDKFFGRTMDLRSANRQYEASVDSLVETIRENGRAWTETTEKGRANQQAIDDNIRAIKELREANIENGMTVEQANAIYDQQLEQLRKTLISLGLNKTEVNNLINAIKAIPAMATVEVKAHGLNEVLAKVRELARLLGSNAAAARALGKGEGTFKQGGDESGYGGGRASGGLMLPGMTYNVAESGTGVERVKMLAGGGAVVQNADQWSAAGGGSGGGSGGGVSSLNVTLSVDRTGMTPLEEALVGALVGYLRVTGGAIGPYQLPRMAGR